MSPIDTSVHFSKSSITLNTTKKENKQPIRFGWNKKQLEDHPDRFTVTLQAGKDVKQEDGELIPQPALARRIASRIARNGNTSVSGFVSIPNVSDFIQAKDNAEMYRKTNAFIDRLTSLVYPHFTRLMPHLKQWNHTLENLSFYRPDGKPKNAEGRVFPKKDSLKSFHKDPHSVLATHAYGPVAGLTGGELLILDDIQAAKDHRVNPTDLYEIRPTEDKNIPCTPHLKAEWAEKLGVDSPYVFAANTHPGKTKDGLDRIPVFMFSNLEVGHGANPLQVHDSNSAVRGFYRSSKATKDEAEKGELPFLPFHQAKFHKK